MPVSTKSPFAILLALGNQHSTPDNMNMTILDTSCKWNHTGFVFLGSAYYFSRHNQSPEGSLCCCIAQSFLKNAWTAPAACMCPAFLISSWMIIILRETARHTKY